MMADFNWNAPAKLLSRDDAGSEMFYEFRDLASGTLREMVAIVMAMDVVERARVLIDAGAAGTMAVGQIMTIASRDDFALSGDS